MSSTNLAYVVPKLAKVWYTDFIEYVVKKREPELFLSDLLNRNEILKVSRCSRVQVFLRAFYDSLNQIDSIFSSKVIILPNYLKNYLEI